MKLKMLIAMLAMPLFFAGVLSSELPEKDVSVEILLPHEINASQEYNSLFELRNHNSTPGVNDGLSVLVEFFVEKNSLKTYNYSVNRSLNVFTRTGMGSLLIEENGDYLLCVFITPNNYVDPNPLNDNDCLNLSVIGAQENISFNETIEEIINETSNITEEDKKETNITVEIDHCVCSINIFTDETLYYKGNTINFQIVMCEEYNLSFPSYPLTVEYWVEDLFGSIVKRKLNTTSTAPKRYTPSFEGLEKGFIVKATFPECEHKDIFSTPVFFRAENTERETSPFLSIRAPEEADAGKVFFVDLEGFKGNTGKTVIDIWVERDGKKYSETTKTYITERNRGFKQRIPVKIKEDTENMITFYEIIAEGLDLRASERIIINPIKQSSESSIAISAKPSINSFYSRKIFFDGEINIFASVSNGKGSTMTVRSTVESLTIPVENSSTITFPLRIASSEEVITGELIQEGVVLDSAFIRLNLTIRNGSAPDDSEPEEVLVEGFEENTGLEAMTTTEEIPMEEPVVSAQSEDAVETMLLESASESNKGRLHEILFFSGAAILVLLVLFGSEIKNSLKKTKFFK